MFGLGSLETVVSRTQDSALGRVYHLDRTLDGYPVWGRQLVVSESNARVRSVTGKMQPLPPLDTRAELGETEALQIAQPPLPIGLERLLSILQSKAFLFRWEGTFCLSLRHCFYRE